MTRPLRAIFKNHSQQYEVGESMMGEVILPNSLTGGSQEIALIDASLADVEQRGTNTGGQSGFVDAANVGKPGQQAPGGHLEDAKISDFKVCGLKIAHKLGPLFALRRDQTVAAEIFVAFLAASGSMNTHISGWALVQAWLG
ncbi:hypothetical protein CSIM01_02780 [Colletotrichum simmondsii]|uniref:Uncharacterized protein n=1 Tax=Colletotrichum simmondsii TaxID=703756 RepID=A0A135T1E3_9PEZI|nr:hypothetical protein CSIM01_02780 [Colletotrichum simmondsii]